MSSESIRLHCDASNSEVIEKVSLSLDALTMSEDVCKLEYKNNGTVIQIQLDGKVLGFYSKKYLEDEIIISLEAKLDNEEEVFSNILKMFLSLGIPIISCEVHYSSTGGGYKLKYTDGDVKWIEMNYMSPTDTKVYISGKFILGYNPPEKELSESGGVLVTDPHSADILAIGEGFDTSIRKYFLDHDLPVVNEKDFYQLFLDDQLLV